MTVLKDCNSKVYFLEKVNFTVTILQNGHLIKNVRIYYEIGPERFPPTKKDSVVLDNGTGILTFLIK